MLKKGKELSLRGLNLENVPSELGWGIPPFEVIVEEMTDL